MNVLALDTCLSACSVAVLRRGMEGAGNGRIVSRHTAMARGHAEALMPMIDDAMREAGIAFSELERIAVTTGPGTFTGMRIGIAAARGLGLAVGCPVVGLTTFAALACNANDADYSSGALAVCIDARREEVYLQVLSSPGAPLCEPAVTSLDAAIDVHPELELAAVGSAAARLVDTAAKSGRRIRLMDVADVPDAAAFIRFAADMAVSETPPSPLYLRAADAKPQSGKSLPRATNT